MLLKKTVLVSIAAVISATTLSAYAAPKYSLTIFNNTSASSTVESNGTCSSFVGKITPPHTEKSYSKLDINLLCLGTFPCEANVYMNDNCDGAPVAKATYNVNADQSSYAVVNVSDPTYTAHVSQVNNQAYVEFVGP